jgi:hypothetical protein
MGLKEILLKPYYWWKLRKLRATKKRVMAETGADEWDIGGGPAGLDPNRVRTLFVPKPGSKAARKDVGKFMKHGKQLPGYRVSIKAKKKPDED